MLLSNSCLKNMKVISFFIFVILINASNNQLTKSSKYWPTKSFDVKNLWNGEDYDEPPVSYHLTKKYINGLNIEISAPFYGDPAPPFNINKGIYYSMSCTRDMMVPTYVRKCNHF